MLCGGLLFSAPQAFLACPPPRYCKNAAFKTPELRRLSRATGPDRLPEEPVSPSLRLVVFECVHRALHGLSPLSVPSGI